MKEKRWWRGDDLLVRSPGHRVWPIFVRVVLMMTVGWLAVAAVLYLDPGPWTAIASGVLGVTIGISATAQFRRLSAFRNGWVRGRTEMVTSLREARRREMYIHEWLSLEWERTAAVMGIDPYPEERTESGDR